MPQRLEDSLPSPGACRMPGCKIQRAIWLRDPCTLERLQRRRPHALVDQSKMFWSACRQQVGQSLQLQEFMQLMCLCPHRQPVLVVLHAGWRTPHVTRRKQEPPSPARGVLEQERSRAGLCLAVDCSALHKDRQALAG
jgi:hypothetical protein